MLTENVHSDIDENSFQMQKLTNKKIQFDIDTISLKQVESGATQIKSSYDLILFPIIISTFRHWKDDWGVLKKFFRVSCSS